MKHARLKHIGKHGLTGKVDIDGTEILDGDILKYPEHQDPYSIKWSDAVAGFVCENSHNYMLACVWCKMKIIGNMRDNPELMEGVNEQEEIDEMEKIVNRTDDIIAQIKECNTRKQAARVYTQILTDMLGVSFNAINKAIEMRWSLSGLKYIKQKAWKMIE